MRSFKTWALSIGIFSVIVHIALIFSLPTILMNKVTAENVKRANGVNKFTHRAKANAKNQGVMRTNPDVAYSGCTVDVSRGPVKVSIPSIKPYSSLSILANNTDNLITVNDLQATGEKIEIVVAKDGQKVPSGIKSLTVSSDQVFALARYVIKDQDSWADLDGLRRKAECRQL